MKIAGGKMRKSGKVAFVAHCLVNQNAKVAEFARLPGVVSPVIDLLKSNGYVIEQLPCPELLFNGVTRWWTTKDIYDNPGYRRHCRSLAKFTADVIEKYHRDRYEVVLIGLDGSPSSGVRFTGTSEPVWGGRPDASIDEYKIVPGRGVWIEELAKELDERGIPFPKASGVLMDSPDFDMDGSVAELATFLSDQPLKFNDSRSFRMVIVADYFLNPQQYEKLPNSPYVYEFVRDSGFGIIKMPPPATPKVALTGWVSSVADQIQESGHHGFTVLLLGMNSLPGKGVWVTELKRELSARGVEMPATKTLSRSDVASRDATQKSLSDFLRQRRRMNALEEISSILSGGGRVIVIAENEVDLKSLRGKNTLFLLKVAEGSLAAGGRGGGFGERRVVAVFAFRYEDGVCEKIFETAEEATVSKFEVPYYVTRMPMTLSDGAESVGYGVVDPELVAAFALIER